MHCTLELRCFPKNTFLPALDFDQNSVWGNIQSIIFVMAVHA